MRTRALTASEAVARLIELGYDLEDKCNYIKDNDYTLPFGETTFEWVNPEPNCFNPSLLYWEMEGVYYKVCLLEDRLGNSNVTLIRFEGRNGICVANYNKMKAAQKKEFMAMLESADRYSLPAPQRERDGWKDASYTDEKGLHQTAWYNSRGEYVTLKEWIAQGKPMN